MQPGACRAGARRARALQHGHELSSQLPMRPPSPYLLRVGLWAREETREPDRARLRVDAGERWPRRRSGANPKVADPAAFDHPGVSLPSLSCELPSPTRSWCRSARRPTVELLLHALTPDLTPPHLSSKREEVCVEVERVAPLHTPLHPMHALHPQYIPSVHPQNILMHPSRPMHPSCPFTLGALRCRGRLERHPGHHGCCGNARRGGGGARRGGGGARRGAGEEE